MNQTEPCHSTRHCVDHGWCHRCDPAFAAVMDRVNEAIQSTDAEASHWGPLYAAVGQAVRAVVSPPTDRAVVLSEVADRLAAKYSDDDPAVEDLRQWADDARRLAVEAHDTGTQQPTPDPAERKEQYAVAIHDAMESDLSLVDQEPGYQALFARAAEAAMALADAEAWQQPTTEAEAAATLARECVDRPAVIRWCADRVRSTDGDYAVLAAAEYLDDLATEIEEAAEAEPAPVAQQPAAEAPSGCAHRGPHPGFTCAEVDQTRPFWDGRWDETPAEQQPAAEAEPGPWVVQKICCGRDDGTPEFATWEAADSFRETYIDSARIAGHERSAIVRRKDATAAEQQAAALRAELTPFQLLAGHPDEPLPQTERVIGGRRLMQPSGTTRPGDATVDPAMCPRCKGDNSEAFELCTACAQTEQQAAAADGEETRVTVYLSTPCDACEHTLNWHRNDVGCTAPDCVCGRFREPVTP